MSVEANDGLFAMVNVTPLGGLAVRRYPRDDAEVLARLPSGTHVRVLDLEGPLLERGWWRVTACDAEGLPLPAARGYVPTKDRGLAVFLPIDGKPVPHAAPWTITNVPPKDALVEMLKKHYAYQSDEPVAGQRVRLKADDSTAEVESVLVLYKLTSGAWVSADLFEVCV